MRRVQQEGAEQIDQRWQQWQTALSDHARILLSHQKAILQQSEQLAAGSARAGDLAELQHRLDENVHSVDAALRSVDEGLERLGQSAVVTDAMMTLARAVEVLSARLPAGNAAEPHTQPTRARRNAA
jgi:DNA repair exonuclease SbcCD ATPase subunit